ncbi:hypothetical protein GCM10009841_13430 [Microlunatus panaciterrae]|uniref:Uncharacterized protein n=1 Tax=Microlunatus panaciterrae TaxID=400768 RepID=A0ABS2RLL4_9ACTN|nr:hypothetical protein [Microlunatus panaciterrae]MBM7799903.1 hypothetical protein [Microlunatus panaciterrae]
MTGRSEGSGVPSPHSDAGITANANDGREPWPRDFGRDGVSGLVSADRALRARDVSRPTREDEEYAESVLSSLLARVEGKRPRASARV